MPTAPASATFTSLCASNPTALRSNSASSRFAYASANETPVIKFVRVHKTDGTTVETPAADAIDMPADVSRAGAALQRSEGEAHSRAFAFPGDTLEYEVDTAINKPEAPGQFWGTDHFTAPGTVVVLAEILTLQVPSEKYVQVWSPNHKPSVAEHDGLKTYTWNVAQLVTAPKSTGDESDKPTPPNDPDEDDRGPQAAQRGMDDLPQLD